MEAQTNPDATSVQHIVMQHFQTPEWCCHVMASMVPAWVNTVLEPTPGEGNLVRALEDRRFNVTAPENFWSIEGEWDCVVMNPPFTPMAQGYKILDKCLGMSKVVIALMPWLTIINSQRRTASLMKFGLREVRHLPRYTFEGSRVQCCILFLDSSFSGQTVFVA